jgi:hypothetical protein
VCGLDCSHLAFLGYAILPIEREARERKDAVKAYCQRPIFWSEEIMEAVANKGARFDASLVVFDPEEV